MITASGKKDMRSMELSHRNLVGLRSDKKEIKERFLICPFVFVYTYLVKWRWEKFRLLTSSIYQMLYVMFSLFQFALASWDIVARIDRVVYRN